MKWQVATLSVVLLAVVLVAAINWNQFSTPVPVNLVLRQVEIPLGSAMLGVCGLLTLLCLLFVAGARTTQLVETRKFARDAHEARLLADQAEASRLAELRQHMDGELAALHDQLTEMEGRLATALDESHNSLVANLAEMHASRPETGMVEEEGLESG